MKSRDLCAALGLCGLLAASPQVMAGARPLCSATDQTDDLALNPGYTACVNVADGRLGGTADLDRLLVSKRGPWSRIGLSSDPGFGPFSANPAGVDSGQLLLDAPRADIFAIGLQATVASVTEFVFYIFDYSAKTPTNRIYFDTFGIDNSQFPGPSLEVAALYRPADSNPPPSGSVPEPAAWALMLAGLGGLGFFVRRRAT